MKVVFLSIFCFLLGGLVFALALNVSASSKLKADLSRCLSLTNQKEGEYEKIALKTDAQFKEFRLRLGDLLERHESAVESCPPRDVSEYCSPDAYEKLSSIAKNYNNVSNRYEYFTSKAQADLDIVRSMADLLGPDLWDRLKVEGHSISKDTLPKLNLVTPSEIPVVSIKKGALTTLVFPSSIERVMGNSMSSPKYDDRMLFIKADGYRFDEKNSSVVVKLTNGDIYPVRFKVTDDEREVDVLLEIKSENSL